MIREKHSCAGRLTLPKIGRLTLPKIGPDLHFPCPRPTNICVLINMPLRWEEGSYYRLYNRIRVWEFSTPALPSGASEKMTSCQGQDPKQVDWGIYPFKKKVKILAPCVCHRGIGDTAPYT